EDSDTPPIPPRVRGRKKDDAVPSIEKEGTWLTKPVLYGIISGAGGLLLVLIVGLIFGLSGSRKPADAPVAAQKEDIKPIKRPARPDVNLPESDPKPEPKLKQDELPPVVPNTEDKKPEDKKKDLPDVKEPPPDIAPPPIKPDPPRPAETNAAKDW